MADTIDVTQVSQAFKERYRDGFIKASPVIRDLQTDFPFDDGGQPGVKYSEAIRMTDEQGVTFSAAGEELTLNDPVALKMEKASFLGNKIEFRSRVSIEAVKRALSSPQAMAETLFVRQESMRDSHMVHKEWTLMNGGQSLGEIAVGGIAAGASAVQKIITFTAQSWCPTWWSRATNMKLDIYDLDSEDLDPASVKRNTSSATAHYRVDDWDPEARTVTLTASAAGDWTNVVAGDRLWRYGAYLKESYGMARIAKDQTGSIFLQAPEGSSTIPVYGQWKGILDDAGGIFTMERVLRQTADIADRSEEMMKLTLRLPSRQFHGLNIELAASRYFDGSYKSTKGENGFQSIEFYSPNGTVTLKPYKYLKWGQALLTDDTCFSRRGVSDTTTVFEGSGEMYFLRQDINQVEFRSYSQDGMFCNKPFRACLFDGLSVPGVP